MILHNRKKKVEHKQISLRSRNTNHKENNPVFIKVKVHYTCCKKTTQINSNWNSIVLAVLSQGSILPSAAFVTLIGNFLSEDSWKHQSECTLFNLFNRINWDLGLAPIYPSLFLEEAIQKKAKMDIFEEWITSWGISTEYRMGWGLQGM